MEKIRSSTHLAPHKPANAHFMQNNQRVGFSFRSSLLCLALKCAPQPENTTTTKKNVPTYIKRNEYLTTSKRSRYIIYLPH